MSRLNIFFGIIGDMFWKLKLFKYKVESIPDNPNPATLKNNVVYLVSGDGYVKWAYLKCPCGCDDTIMLSLNKNNFPSWSVKQDKLGRATISPSINKLDGCKSHFSIKKGKLLWYHFF